MFPPFPLSFIERNILICVVFGAYWQALHLSRLSSLFLITVFPGNVFHLMLFTAFEMIVGWL